MTTAPHEQTAQSAEERSKKRFLLWLGGGMMFAVVTGLAVYQFASTPAEVSSDAGPAIATASTTARQASEHEAATTASERASAETSTTSESQSHSGAHSDGLNNRGAASNSQGSNRRDSTHRPRPGTTTTPSGQLNPAVPTQLNEWYNDATDALTTELNNGLEQVWTSLPDPADVDQFTEGIQRPTFPTNQGANAPITPTVQPSQEPSTNSSQPSRQVPASPETTSPTDSASKPESAAPEAPQDASPTEVIKEPTVPLVSGSTLTITPPATSENGVTAGGDEAPLETELPAEDPAGSE